MKKIIGLFVFAFCGYASVLAVDLSLSSSVASSVNRGDNVDYEVTVVSDSTDSVGGATVGVDLPVSFIDDSSLYITPSDYSIVGNKIIWNNQTFSPLESRIYKISGRVSSAAVLGLNDSTSYVLLSSDSELTNNSRIRQIQVSAQGTASVKSNMPGSAPVFEDIAYDVSVINKGSLTLSNLVLGYIGNSSFVITSMTPRQGTYNGTSWSIPELGVGGIATMSVAGYYNTNTATSTWWQLQSLSEKLNNASLTSQLGDEVDSAVELEIKPEVTGTTGSRSPATSSGPSSPESSGSIASGTVSTGVINTGSVAGTGSSTGSEVSKSGGAGSSSFSSLLVAGPSGGGSYGTNVANTTGGTGTIATGTQASGGVISSGSSGKRALIGLSGVVLTGNVGTGTLLSGVAPLDVDWKHLKSKLPAKKVIATKKKVRVCSVVKRAKRNVRICRWK